MVNRITRHLRQNVPSSPPYRVWALIEDEWMSKDCNTAQEAMVASTEAVHKFKATYTVVAVPGELEYEGDMSVINGHIVMGRI